MDPISHDTFTNSNRLVLLKPTGKPSCTQLLLFLLLASGDCAGSSSIAFLLPEAISLCWHAGDVMLLETYEKCIKPEGHYNGKKIKDSDVIELQKGGTGFAAHDGKETQSSKHWILGPGSGRADLRGQHQGPRSATGLSFMN